MATPLDRFQELLRIPTVSHADESLTDWAVFENFVATLERLYPAMHTTLEREIVGEHSLLYRWAGSETGEELVLMAHQDVVSVSPEEWTHAPFGAEVTGTGADAVVNARGAIDDKGSLVAIVEAVEALVAAGFVPAHDVYLAFGHNEETAGDGAKAIADLLRARGVTPALILDEGGAVVDNVLPGLMVPSAMVGVAERGVMTLELSVAEAGGHASTPPTFPATARLARAIGRIHRRPFPTRIAPPVRALLASAAPHMTGPLAGVFARVALTGPLLAQIFARLGPETNALVRTTAVITELQGAVGQNVLATSARASLNVRLLTGDTAAAATDRIRRVIGDPLVEITVRHATDPSTVSPWRGDSWRRIAGTVRDALGENIVTLPYIQLGASDSRWFTGLSAHVYRFTPFHLTRAERDALHAPNERIRVDVWLRGIEFYRLLIERS